MLSKLSNTVHLVHCPMVSKSNVVRLFIVFAFQVLLHSFCSSCSSHTTFKILTLVLSHFRTSCAHLWHLSLSFLSSFQYLVQCCPSRTLSTAIKIVQCCPKCSPNCSRSSNLSNVVYLLSAVHLFRTFHTFLQLLS